LSDTAWAHTAGFIALAPVAGRGPPQQWREYLQATFACATHRARGGTCRTTS